MHLQHHHVRLRHLHAGLVGLPLLVTVLDKDLVPRPLHLCGTCICAGVHAFDSGANINVQESLLWWQEKREEVYCLISYTIYNT